jgi:uncharacterized protein YbjT (DUF2867 family)
MRVFVAGATGAIGRQLVPRLVAASHEVHGMTRSARKRGKPRRVPAFVVRLLAGEAAVMMMTSARGASNARAKRELAWNPPHASWRQGFAAA